MHALSYRFCPLFFALWPVLAGAAPGEWPEPRQNPHLTAAQPLAGKMTQAPACVAKYDLGRSQPAITAAAMPEGGETRGLAIVAGALHCYSTSGALLWRCHPAGLNFTAISVQGDLDGDGAVEILLQAGRPADPYAAAVIVALKDGAVLWRYDVDPMSYAWYLHAGDYVPESPGQEIVVLMHGYPPDKDNGYIALFRFPESGKPPVQQWRYDFDLYTCFPTFYQTDLDGDGKRELAVETHSRMWFFDAATGEKRHFVQWDVSPANIRSYGLTEFVDLNRDGREDFLCVATFAQHHEVLLNKGGRLELAWTHGWPESVTTGKVASTWPKQPYADVDGDGQFEIIVSMFNSENEGAWLVRVYDAISGTLKYRMPGMIAEGTADLDGDGKSELLCNVSVDPTRTKLSGARLLQLRNGALETIWADDAATALGLRKNDALVIERAGEKSALRMDASGSVTFEAWEKPPKEHKADFSAVPAIQGPAFPTLLAADLDADGRNEVVLYREPNIEVLRLNGGTFERAGTFSSDAVPVLADMNGDDKTDLVVCQVRPEAPPAVEAISTSAGNQSLWRVQLPPPERPGLPQPRKAYLRTAHFTGRPAPDLYLWAGTPVVRSVALDGRSGAVLWEKGECPGIERYYGPSVNLASVWDFDGDGKDDLIFTNPDYYCAASGVNGDLLVGPLYPPKIFNQPSQGLYTLPAILKEDGKDPTVCLVAGHYFQAAMSLRAAPYWHQLPPVGQNRCTQEGFLRRANGAWLMGFGRQNGQFACLNVSDGSTRWELPIEASASDAVSGDIDGDGTPEFVFGTSHGALIAVGDDNAQAALRWRLEENAALGAPILADVNGDGASEIVLSSADGWLRVYAAESK